MTTYKEPISKEEIIKFLEELGIKTELINIDQYGFSREIAFKVYDTEYVINWWVNQSYLHIGRHNRSSLIPFKHMIYNTTYPLIGGNKCIVFVDELLEVKSPFDQPYVFGVFRIPIEIKSNVNSL